MPVLNPVYSFLASLSLSQGDPSAVLPILSFSLTTFPPLNEQLMAAGFELTGKTDLRFTETLFKVRDTRCSFILFTKVLEDKSILGQDGLIHLDVKGAINTTHNFGMKGVKRMAVKL